MEKTNNICIKAVKASSNIERNNSDLKRIYLIKHIVLFNYISRMINGNFGTFGTGYPFYALKDDLTGKLPVIQEQLRYNDELLLEFSKSNSDCWTCIECLTSNIDNMPDLKKICKPCQKTIETLKPRKVINRLLDIDMWIVCEKDSIEKAQKDLIQFFSDYNLTSSDINPLQTINSFSKISIDLSEGIMPSDNLPIDAHIIDEEALYTLIEQTPYTIRKALEKYEIPYLPILPLSYRKIWQYDDKPYNFIHDYLSSLTEFNFDKKLKKILDETRSEIINNYSSDELYELLLQTGGETVLKRHRTKELKNRFEERVNKWKNL